jgi:hypothetical protein
LSYIARLLARHRDDPLVEEIAAAVWEALLERGMSRLAVFNSRRGSLGGFLNGLALRETQKRLRALKAEADRLVPLEAAGPLVDPRGLHAPDQSEEALAAKVRAGLTPALRECFEEQYLGISRPADAPPLSDDAQYQRMHRLALEMERALGLLPGTLVSEAGKKSGAMSDKHPVAH